MDCDTFPGEAPLQKIEKDEIAVDELSDPQNFSIEDTLKPLVNLIQSIPRCCIVEWMNPDYTFHLRTGSSMLTIKIEDNENYELFDTSSWYLYKSNVDAEYTSVICEAIIEHLIDFIKNTRSI